MGLGVGFDSDGRESYRTHLLYAVNRPLGEFNLVRGQWLDGHAFAAEKKLHAGGIGAPDVRIGCGACLAFVSTWCHEHVVP